MRIGLLTGGGDCPGLNAAIRAVVTVAEQGGDEIVAFHHGWRGVVEGDAEPLGSSSTRSILQRGGTILRTARFHPEEHEGGVPSAFETVECQRLDALIAIGGDGTLMSAHRLAQAGMKIVGIPKTIDNDVMGTHRCIGFDTAVATAADAIDRVQTTGESHDRLMVVEVMGRSTGWLAVSAGITAGADVICLPERLTDVAALAKALSVRHNAGFSSSVVVVAEGAQFCGDREVHARSAGALVAHELAQRTGFETRLTVLGHVQRGGPPVPSDRLLATRFGVAAIDAVRAGSYDTMVRLEDEAITLAPLEVVANGCRPVPTSLIELAQRFALMV